MARFLRNRKSSLGNIPGELSYHGRHSETPVSINLISYGEQYYQELEIEQISQLQPVITDQSDKVHWIHVTGIHNTLIMEQLRELFRIHSLTMENIMNTGQRPKMEQSEHNNTLTFFFKLLQYQNDTVESEQGSMVLGSNYLITFQEGPGDFFDSIRDRIQKDIGRVRRSGADYLSYAILDRVVDYYLAILETLGELIEDVEEGITQHPTQPVIEQINIYKRELTYLRKAVFPLRDSLIKMSKLEDSLIQKSTKPFMGDLFDHILQTVEIIDTYRDLLSDFLNVYNTNVSNRLNEIMKLLTMFSALFIPLTFIAGIYGTNFDYIPELKWRYGYPIFLGVLLVVAIGMILYFKKKKW